ncbi:aminoglycoside O-phosphotransferase APH(3')-IIIa, partial [Streptococcus suis]|nr:aminoglycoside O-phosphotransferase APH(3')-IIIa [Streptococcus suis]
SDCPYTNSVHSRLAEEDYLLKNDLAEVECENREEDTTYKDQSELYDLLKTEKNEEELVFYHGDQADRNNYLKDCKVTGFIYLGR